MEPIAGNPSRCLVTNRISNGFLKTDIPVLTPHLFTVVHLALDRGQRVAAKGGGFFNLKNMAEARAHATTAVAAPTAG